MSPFPSIGLCYYASGRSSIKHSSKFEHAFGSGTANGGGGSAGAGQNGGTRSPAQGGGNFIPVYAAGAANNRHQNHHHGSGNCNRNRNSIGLSTLVAGILGLSHCIFIVC
uniref:Uncharacterized protein n=1 Tax=Fagus sylvatica TaxID=28930 RepID=A0A2N9FKI1_FAGSY